MTASGSLVSENRGHAGRRPIIVVGGTAHWGSLRLAEHHVTRELARQGHEVLFVDPPLSPLTVRRRPELARFLDGERLRRVADGVHVLVPVVVPGKDRPGATRLADFQIRRAIAAAIHRLDAAVTATVLTLPQRELFPRSLGGTRIYWAKDDHRAGAHLYGLDPDRLARSERRLIDAADHFLVCSEGLAERWGRSGARPRIFANGCDAAHFATATGAPTPPDVAPDRRYAVFVGSLTSRIDVSLLERVADEGIDVLLVGAARRSGEGHTLASVLDHPRIHAVGQRSYDQLPGYLGAASVGLVPYGRGAYNDGSFPLKLLEYLAAGLPVVSTGLPAARWLDTGHVRVADDPDGFAQLVRAAMNTPKTDAARQQRQDLAAAHDWSVRAAQLAGLLRRPSVIV